MMWRFRELLARFMYGRHGIDQFSVFLIVVYLVIALASLFTRTYIITILELLLLVYFAFRMLSRNTVKRSAENARFLKIWSAVSSWFHRASARIKESRTRVYHKCPNCKATLRLPRRKGKHTVACPKCGKDFQMKVWFGPSKNNILVSIKEAPLPMQRSLWFYTFTSGAYLQCAFQKIH